MQANTLLFHMRLGLVVLANHVRFRATNLARIRIWRRWLSNLRKIEILERKRIISIMEGINVS